MDGDTPRDQVGRQRSRRRILRVLIYTFLFTQLGMAGVFVINEFFQFTSSNSAIYLVRGDAGGVEVKRDLFIEDADRLIFTVDFNGVLAKLKRELAVARGSSSLELTWDSVEGVGDVKMFRSDGTAVSLSFSRYREDAGPIRGLFLGGDLPYADSSRSRDGNTSGFGYNDGQAWYHIWCASNEGFSISGTDSTVVPPLWEYLGSRVLKDSAEEVIIESRHEAELEGARVKMTRLVSVRADRDYFILKVKFANASTKAISYNYAYGDEPWLGQFGSSSGDVGWYEGGLVQYEQFISPAKYKYVGYWDIGNPAAEEKDTFTGYANFVEWLSPTPSYVFFANSFTNCCNETSSLSHEHERILDIVWLNQLLMPGESRDHTLAIGMAKQGPDGLPLKPSVTF
jgi:hypothetical protein